MKEEAQQEKNSIVTIKDDLSLDALDQSTEQADKIPKSETEKIYNVEK